MTAADRRAGDVLSSAGLHDARTPLRTDLVPTAGHHPDDPHDPRAVDRIHITTDLVDALDTVTVHDAPVMRTASDYLPVAVSLDLTRI